MMYKFGSNFKTDLVQMLQAQKFESEPFTQVMEDTKVEKFLIDGNDHDYFYVA